LRYSSALPNCNASSHAESLRDVKAMYYGLMHLNHHIFSRTLQHSTNSWAELLQNYLRQFWAHTKSYYQKPISTYTTTLSYMQ